MPTGVRKYLKDKQATKTHSKTTPMLLTVFMLRKKIRKKKITFENRLATESRTGTRWLLFSSNLGEILLWRPYLCHPWGQPRTRSTERLLVTGSQAPGPAGRPDPSLLYLTVKVKHRPSGCLKYTKPQQRPEPDLLGLCDRQGLSKLQMKDSFSDWLLLFTIPTLSECPEFWIKTPCSG